MNYGLIKVWNLDNLQNKNIIFVLTQQIKFLNKIFRSILVNLVNS